jgi:hypothetical protein
LPTETALDERTTKSACALALELEISEELEQALRSEHARLIIQSKTTLEWDRFLQACLIIGLDELKRIPALEALERIDALEG